MSKPPLILVTGATGFIGRHLCNELVNRGYFVRGCYRGRHPEIQGVEWCELGDIGPDTQWEGPLNNITHVIHLASLAHQVGVDGEEIRQCFHRINVEGTKRLVDYLASAKVKKKFYYVSSSGAVCSQSEALITDQTPCHPDSDYGRSKLAAELVIKENLADGSVPWVIVRPSLVYGPGNPGNMGRLLRLILTGVPLPLGRIHNRRSLLYVGNLVDALIHILENQGAIGQILSINDGEPISTPDLLRTLGKVSGHRVRIMNMPIAILRVMALVGDLLKAILGRSIGLDTYSLDRLVGSHAVDAESTFKKIQWCPPYSTEEGLRLTFHNEVQ